ncbi:MAG: hypothetical protein M3Z85_19010 [Acidobacteriota bacterium]|nr:hypothetical protein [Acidobacteriota bacterium]
MNPLVSQKLPYAATGFAAKLDSTGSKILFSTFLGGHQVNPFPGSSLDSNDSRATNIALDAAGNAYITGITTQADFPQTSALLGSGKPQNDGPSGRIYTFVTKISADGAHLIYSTFIGADKFRSPRARFRSPVCAAIWALTGLWRTFPPKGPA